MTPANINVKFLLNLVKVESILVRHFDKGMGNGIGFNEFLILFYLNQSDNQKMRRVDLAEKMSMTASGITRMLLPMEKIGLISNDSAGNDARVKSVLLSSGGKQKFNEALERFEFLAEGIFSGVKNKEIESCSNLLVELGGKILMS